MLTKSNHSSNSFKSRQN